MVDPGRMRRLNVVYNSKRSVKRTSIQPTAFLQICEVLHMSEKLRRGLRRGTSGSPDELDITAAERFKKLYTDPFTGLGNMFDCLVTLDEVLQGVGSREDRTVCLILVDIDRLSELNVQAGWNKGDQAILLARTTLLDVVGDPACVFRFSRDTFALIDGGHPADGWADEIVATYRSRASEVFSTEVVPTVSLGGAVARADKVTMGQLISRANDALQRIKKQGGDAAEICEVGSCPPEDPVGSQSQLLTAFADQLLQTLDILEDMSTVALTDPLTQLPNQRAAEIYLENLEDEAESSGEVLSILLVDGDNLKEYNSKLGYRRGDEMISWLADLLRSSKRSEDFLARWFMGDEFLLVLPRTGRDDAQKVSGRLRDTVRCQSQSLEIPITVSVGTATYPHDADNLFDLLTLAQDACREAKERGRDRTVDGRDLN